MLIDYNPILVSIIVHVPMPLLLKIQPLVSNALEKLETDDRAYIYTPDEYHIGKKRSVSLAALSNFKPIENFRLDYALKHTLSVIGPEDIDVNKYIFIILNHFNKNESEHGVIKCFNIDINKDYRCNFIFCDIGNASDMQHLCSHHHKCQYLKINNLQEMSSQLSNVYYPELKKRQHEDQNAQNISSTSSN